MKNLNKCVGKTININNPKRRNFQKKILSFLKPMTVKVKNMKNLLQERIMLEE